MNLLPLNIYMISFTLAKAVKSANRTSSGTSWSYRPGKDYVDIFKYYKALKKANYGINLRF